MNGVLAGPGSSAPNPGVLVVAGGDNLILSDMEVRGWENGVALDDAGPFTVTSLKLVNSYVHGNTNAGLRIPANAALAGVITINDHLISHGLAETPWGGFKESGIGRSHGRQGFDEMTETQVVVDELLPFLSRNLFWHPYSKSLYEGLLGLLDFLYARGIGRRWRGLRRVTAILPRMFRR